MSEKIVQLNKEVNQGQLKELYEAACVEETLNALLETKTEKLTQITWYDRNK